jgi:hypothetical protein
LPSNKPINIKVASLEAALYPNPSNEKFKLSINSNSTLPIVVRVFNTTGQLKKSFIAKPNAENSFGEELKAGLYMVIITQGHDDKVLKALKL